MKNSYIVTIESMKESSTISMKSKKAYVVNSIINISIIILGVIFIFIGLYKSDYKMMGFSLIVSLSVLWIIIMTPFVVKLGVKSRYRGMIQKSFGREVRATNEFNETEMIVFDERSSGKKRIPYSEIIKTVESKNLFVILLNNNSFVSISKNGFIDCTQDDFISFISSKGPIKLIKHHKG